MARHAKDTVDYFPHYCDHGKTLYIIEQHYGNDGYAFWFKLLELLGKTEGHFYDCSSIDNWEFLQAKTRFLGVKCQEILDKLALLGAIDRFLWENDRIIWSDNLVANVADAYKNRKRPVPLKPISRSKIPISTPDNPQTILEENKEKESRKEQTTPHEETITPPVDNSPGDTVLSQSDGGDGSAEAPKDAGSDFMAFWTTYPRPEGMGKAIEAWDKMISSEHDPQVLVLAAGKYAIATKAANTPFHEIVMPDEFLLKGTFNRYLPPPRDKPPDCSQCQYKADCHNGVILREVPYEHGGSRSESTPCPYRMKKKGAA